MWQQLPLHRDTVRTVPQHRGPPGEKNNGGAISHAGVLCVRLHVLVFLKHSCTIPSALLLGVALAARFVDSVRGFLLVEN